MSHPLALLPPVDFGRQTTQEGRHYDERQLGALVLMVSITNFFNRVNTTFRVPAGLRRANGIDGA